LCGLGAASVSCYSWDCVIHGYQRAASLARVAQAPQATDDSQEPLGESLVRFECGSATWLAEEAQTRGMTLPESWGAFGPRQVTT
jgi:hypothetical protein